ncbi:hypothetical protein [Actinomadura flavalba]|uniref:hypothetical protein n=1 Tax=Actinomadura flavalba TaxID=1120938 RepID=UPI00039F1D9B|nr:hypothetical protein [Actinomadura flavalba]
MRGVLRGGARGAVVAGLAFALTGAAWLARPASMPGPVADRPAAARPGPLTADDPFRGSPAAAYRDGEFGIVTPKPRAMAGFTAREVALAYWHVRKMISAANLDRGAVYEGRPDALAALLEAEQGALLRADASRRAWITAFAPGSTSEANPTVKVKGTITSRAAAHHGAPAVRVRGRHNFVYAVRPPSGNGPVARVVVRRATDILIYRQGPAVKLWLLDSGHAAAGVRCDVPAGGLVPDFARGGRPGGTVDPYDLKADVPAGCRPVSRV